MFWNFQDELLKELEDLQNQDLEDELLNIPSVPATNLPAATSNRGNYRAQTCPTNGLIIDLSYHFIVSVKPSTSKRNDEEDELSKMSAWANS